MSPCATLTLTLESGRFRKRPFSSEVKISEGNRSKYKEDNGIQISVILRYLLFQMCEYATGFLPESQRVIFSVPFLC